ncbi:MAG: S8 family serine peptidase, partial [Planctomycetales bacterium]|nr:S8 family serine peptidase [Planctomycetales bacterium]
LLEQRKKVREDAARAREAGPPTPEPGDPAGKARAADGKRAEQEEDLGPCWDLLVFRRGGEWVAALDTDRDGDLAEEAALRSFREAGETARFPEEVSLAFGVDIRDEGDRTVLLMDGGGHGTHVAGIIGAWYGAGDPLNGVAPGAQVVAAVCGNPRYGGATTHNALLKAVDWCCRRGAQVVNVSFGGDSFFQDGREVNAKYVDECVRRYGVPIVFSAGNNGPALSTVGTPATSARALAVAACAPRLTQETNYGVPSPKGTLLFDFSSRGPLLTGDPGVDILTPGAAVSTLPPWHLRRDENWHGTSMAAPQATGAIALLLSAAKARGVPASEARVRQALLETARPLPGLTPLEQGAGLLRVPEAFAWLERAAGAAEPVRARVSAETGGPAGGIYLRNLRDGPPLRTSWHVAPDLRPFPEPGANEARAAFGLALRLESEAPWLEAARGMRLGAGGTWLPVTVHPDRVPAGLSVARVRGRDEATGAEVFSLCATVVRPSRAGPPDWGWTGPLSFEPGDRRSVFLEAPPGATRLRVRLRETAGEANSYTLAVATPSAWEGTSLNGRERVRLRRGEERVSVHRVEEGAVTEVALVSRWQESRAGAVEVLAEFHGVASPDGSVRVAPGRTSAPLRLHSGLRDVEAAVSASLSHRVEPLAVSWEVVRDPFVPTVLGEEAMWLGRGRAEIECPEGRSVTVDVGSDPRFSDFLDDATWEAHDGNGRRVGTGHFWSGSFDFAPPRAGRYRLLLTLTSRGRSRLDSAAAAGVLSPVVLRPMDSKALRALPDVAAVDPSADRLPDPLRLPRGERRVVLLALPDLPAGARFRGTATVRDARRDLVLLESRLEVETAAPPPADPVREPLAAAVRAEAERLARDRRATAGETGRLRDLLARAAAAGVAEPERERLSVEVALATDGRDREEVGAILEKRVKHDGGELAPDRRADIAWALGARADLERLRGDLAAAWKSWHAGGLLAPDAPHRREGKLRLLLADGKVLDALALATDLLEARPDDRALRRTRLDLYAKLGWDDRVRAELEGWTQRFPAAGDEVVEVARSLAGGRGGPGLTPAAGGTGQDPGGR